MKKLFTLLIIICLSLSLNFGAVIAFAVGEIFGETVLDFSADDGGAFTGHNGSGWTVGNGKYSPSAAGAIIKSTNKINIDDTVYLSFDFFVPSAPFQFVLLTDVVTSWGGGLGFHIMNDAVRLYEGLDPNVWIGDSALAASTLLDGRAHNLKLKIGNGKASYYIDGSAAPLSFNNGEFTEVSLSEKTSLSGAAQIVFRAADANSYIDNFKVSATDILFVAPEQPDTSYEELTLDFGKASDATNFAAGFDSSGWRVEGGRFYPVAGWNSTYVSQPVDMSDTTYVSFDYFIGKNAGSNKSESRFAVSFLPDLNDDGNGLGFHQLLLSDRPYIQLNESLALKDWIADLAFNWNDGNVHNLKLKISDRKVTCFVDGNPMSFGDNMDNGIALPFSQEKAYLFFMGTSTMTYIDNFKISKSDIVFRAPIQDVPSDFEEILADFSDNSLFTADGNEGWVAENNKLVPKNAWAVAYLSEKIPLTSEKTLSFTFNVDGAAAGTQFNAGLRNATGEGVSTGLSLHFFNPGTGVQDLRLSYWFGNPFESVVGTYTAKQFIDGKDHTAKIIVKDNSMALVIDNEIIFKEIEINMQSGYFTLQSSVKTANISSFSVKNKAEPLTLPDASLDISYPLDGGGVEPKRNLTDNGFNYDPVFVALFVTFTAGSVAAVITAVVFTVKKIKKGKGGDKT